MQGGFPRIEADEAIDLHYGLGYMHGHDRLRSGLHARS
jgi:acyl-homoserine lactone acylase PvdQ